MNANLSVLAFKLMHIYKIYHMCYNEKHMMYDWFKNNAFLRKLYAHRPFQKSAFTADNINIKGVSVGQFSYGVPGIIKLTDAYTLSIGRFCSIAKGVCIIVDGNHQTHWISTYPFGHMIEGVPMRSDVTVGKGDMVIGNDVWIGCNAIILPGVQIGDGAMIAAGSVVTKNVADYEVVGGNPAKHIAYRFDPEQIKSLKAIAWWNWSLDKIKREVPMLQSENLIEFIKKTQ